MGQMIVIGSFTANWLGWACGYAPAGEFQWRCVRSPPCDCEAHAKEQVPAVDPDSAQRHIVRAFR